MSAILTTAEPARDLPPRERYAVLAEASSDRGDQDAARWFRYKAEKLRHH